MHTRQSNNRTLRGTAALITSVLLLNTIFASIAYAAATIEWSPSTGVVVASAVGYSASPEEQKMTQVTRSDLLGSAYYYVTWFEEGTGNLNVTRYDANGVEQTGFPFTIKDNGAGLSNGLPRTVSDNNGGVIVVWSDNRNNAGDANTYDLFGERIDATGATQWNVGNTNGILLVDSGYNDEIGDAVADGNGGITIAFRQNHSITTFFDDYVYLVRIDGNGTTNGSWPANGLSVPNLQDNTTSNHYGELHMIATPDDAVGDADSLPEYIVYYGPGGGPSGVGFRSRKTFSSGSHAWSDVVTTPGTLGASQAWDRIASDGAGGAYLFRHDNSFWKAEHLQSDGTFDAPFGTLDIAPFALYNEEISVINDGSTGAIAVMTVDGTTNPNILAVRFDNTGTTTWSQVVNADEGAREPIVTRDNSNNPVVVWHDYLTEDLYIQRLNASTGIPQYVPDLKLTNSTNAKNIIPEPTHSGWGGMTSQGNIAISNSNEAFIVWDESSLTNYIQKVDITSGTLGLGASAQAIVANGTNPKNQYYLGGTRTSDGGYILAWRDFRNYNGEFDPVAIYAEKFDSTGTRLWNPAEPGNGILISNDYQQDGFIKVAPTDDGGAIFTWLKKTTAFDDSQVYAQRVDNTGTVLWDGAGVLIGGLANGDILPEIISDGNNGAFISWISVNDGIDDLMLTHIQATDGTTDPSWNGGNVLVVDNIIFDPDNLHKLISIDTNTIGIAYTSLGGTGDHLMAAKINKSNGTFSTDWGTNPLIFAVPITYAGYGIDACTDNNGGLYVAFTYTTGVDIGDNGNDSFLGIQHILSDGTIDFTTPTGQLVTDLPQDNRNPQIINDNNGTTNNAIVAFENSQFFAGEVYVQKITSTQTTPWGTTGIAVSDLTDGYTQKLKTSLSDDTPRVITSNGGYGVIIPFTSLTSNIEITNIYAQHINGSGIAQWTAGGELIESVNTATTIDNNLFALGDGNGGALFTWARAASRIGQNNDIYAQYVTDTNGGVCAEGGATSFCGQQEITTASLSFTSIPDSFVFPTITASGTTQNLFNNGTANPPTEAGADHDLLTVYDNRGDPGDGGIGGGFTVQVNNSTTFTDGVNVIPITNLYTATATDSTSIIGTTPVNGVMYEDISTIPVGNRNISAPVDAGNIGTTITLANLENASTYTNIFPGLPNPGSQFGNGDIVLMDGTLPATAGRNGHMSQFINYYLTLPPANQLSGNYSVILTFTLFDSTT